MRGAEVNGGPNERGPELVVVGHVGTSIVHAGAISWTSAGGSGYAVAATAGALIGGRAGLVAAVGKDYDLAPLRNRQVDLDGVTELPGPSAKLRVREFNDGSRSFSAELGVAAAVQTETWPARYLDADYIHLGTAPPEQQLTWLEYLHERGCRAHISADMFEHYVATYPTASREVCDSVDLIFMNQAEYDGLYGDAQLPVPKAPLIVKRGPSGARLIVDGHPQEVEAPVAQFVDPTGGGEVLAGVFLALRADGLPERRALRYAVRAAAACVADYGVTGSHLTAELEVIRVEAGNDGEYQPG
jgi:sugar/nucleoside kinase (ribokinase family)